ncbi:MAG TPA: hypothetical protein VGA67_05785 [Candidatus Dojkabacteria bacterium]|jgi:hypothetical protein
MAELLDINTDEYTITIQGIRSTLKVDKDTFDLPHLETIAALLFGEANTVLNPLQARVKSRELGARSNSTHNSMERLYKLLGVSIEEGMLSERRGKTNFYFGYGNPMLYLSETKRRGVEEKLTEWRQLYYKRRDWTNAVFTQLESPKDMDVNWHDVINSEKKNVGRVAVLDAKSTSTFDIPLESSTNGLLLYRIPNPNDKNKDITAAVELNNTDLKCIEEVIIQSFMGNDGVFNYEAEGVPGALSKQNWNALLQRINDKIIKIENLGFSLRIPDSVLRTNYHRDGNTTYFPIPEVFQT